MRKIDRKMKTRVIHTKFWHDGFVSELTHKTKLAFVYFFTNEKVNISGIYELPDKYICLELNISQTELSDIKKKLETNKKVLFCNGWIIVPNLDKYNNYSGPKNEIARLKELKTVPKKVIEYIKGIDTSIYTSMYRVYIPTRNKKPEIRNKKSETSNKKSKIRNKKESLMDEIRKKHNFLNSK